MIENDFYGADTQWFVGVIKEMGPSPSLVRVRIFGKHPIDSFEAISDGDLPWATVAFPVTSSGGHSLTVGTWVVGIFADPGDYQQPIVMFQVKGDLAGQAPIRGQTPGSQFSVNSPTNAPPNLGTSTAAGLANGYNIGFYRTLAEAQEGAARYREAADYARSRPQNYSAEEMRAVLRLEAASAAEVVRLSGQSTPESTSNTASGSAATSSGVGIRPPQTTPAGSRPQSAYNFFHERLSSLNISGHLLKTQVSAVIGNLMTESGPALNPDAQNPSSSAYGIAQWTYNGDRRGRLERFSEATARGANQPFDKQLNFIWHEFNGAENRSFRQLIAATSLVDAVAAMVAYERDESWQRVSPGSNVFAPNRTHIVFTKKLQDSQRVFSTMVYTTERATS